jgi:hypothetical protein
MPKSPDWVESEIEILKQEYKGKSPAHRVQKALRERSVVSRSIFAIQHKAREHNLQLVTRKSFPNGGKEWSEEDDEFLLKYRQQRSLSWLREKLKRSMAAINWRCSVLNINGDTRDGWYTLVETAEILGMQHVLLGKLIKENKMRAMRRNGKGEYKDWEIREEDIYAFATRYPQFLQNRNCDMVQLVNILTKGGIKYKN